MIRSMTGYGEAERSLPEGQLRVTIKTVNHRFFNAHLRTPSGYDSFEATIQQWLRAFFSRGHINLTIALERERGGGEEGLPELDLDRAKGDRGRLQPLKEEVGLGGEVEISNLLRFNDIFRAPESAGVTLTVDEGVLKEVTEEAAARVVEMRETEGARLEEDLLEHVLLRSLPRRRELRLLCSSVRWTMLSHVEELFLYVWLENSICPRPLSTVRYVL